jgi:hypothetical protein
MPPKKNVAKKRCAEGTAERLGGPLGSPIVSPAPQALENVSPEPEVAAEMHSLVSTPSLLSVLAHWWSVVHDLL